MSRQRGTDEQYYASKRGCGDQRSHHCRPRDTGELGPVHPWILASSDRRGMLNVAASIVLPTVRVLRVVWLNLIFT